MWSTPSSSNATPNWSVVTQLTAVADRSPAPGFPANWYPDPWGVAPWRWWDGTQWTPVLYGPYGEAWPTQMSPTPPFVPKGPGIKGGGVAAVGAGVGLVGTSRWPSSLPSRPRARSTPTTPGISWSANSPSGSASSAPWWSRPG